MHELSRRFRRVQRSFREGNVSNQLSKLSRTHINVDFCPFAFATTCFAFANQFVPGYITTTAGTKAISTIYTLHFFNLHSYITTCGLCVCV